MDNDNVYDTKDRSAWLADNIGKFSGCVGEIKVMTPCEPVKDTEQLLLDKIAECDRLGIDARAQKTWRDYWQNKFIELDRKYEKLKDDMRRYQAEASAAEEEMNKHRRRANHFQVENMKLLEIIENYKKKV
jgi:hypothetical protein